MKAKIDHFKKLMQFLGEDIFEMPVGPGSHGIVNNVQEHMRQPHRMDDRDVVDVSLAVANPSVIKIFTANVSGHNGSAFDNYHEDVSVFEEFLDFAIEVLRNRAGSKIDDQMRAEELHARQVKIEKRMKELGL